MSVDSYFPYIFSAYSVAVFVLVLFAAISVWQFISRKREQAGIEKAEKR